MKQDETEEIDRDALEEAIRRLQRNSLEPLQPHEALGLYLQERQSECADATIKSHRSRLTSFVEWCKKNGVTNLNELTGRSIHEYRIWRFKHDHLSTPTEKSVMDTLRVFIRWCESIEAVSPGLSKKVRSPSLDNGEESREEMVSHERVSRILTYLDQYMYASIGHVVMLLITKTGIRVGTLHALDVEDVHDDGEYPHLTTCHHPCETPLKNKDEGERCIFVSESVREVLTAYLEDKRIEIMDEFGRKPLLTTQDGRMAKSTIRKRVYEWTRPCKLGKNCPHNTQIKDCSAATRANKACECPSSVSPHPFRRGYLTHELEQGVPIHILSDRADVTESVLREHYDQRDDEQQMKQRKEIIQAAHQEGSDYDE